MLATNSCRLVCFNTKSHSHLINISNRKTHLLTTFAKKKDFPDIKPKTPLKITTLVRSAAVGVFALGFIDAGYSGDWSRIGVISRGTEDLLKDAAFFLVPLSIFLIYKITSSE